MLLRALVCLSFITGACAEDIPVIQNTLDILQKSLEPVIVNPGAEIEIGVFQSELAISLAFGRNILGCYGENMETHKKVIFIVGPWTETSHVLTHEFVHALEDAMPNQADKIRAVFHKLCTPEFRIGYQDLEPVLDFSIRGLQWQRGKLYK